jgi:hypothetical protein
MNQAFCEGAEAAMKGRGGLRAEFSPTDCQGRSNVKTFAESCLRGPINAYENEQGPALAPRNADVAFPNGKARSLHPTSFSSQFRAHEIPVRSWTFFMTACLGWVRSEVLSRVARNTLDF